MDVLGWQFLFFHYISVDSKSTFVGENKRNFINTMWYYTHKQLHYTMWYYTQKQVHYTQCDITHTNNFLTHNVILHTQTTSLHTMWYYTHKQLHYTQCDITHTNAPHISGKASPTRKWVRLIVHRGGGGRTRVANFWIFVRFSIGLHSVLLIRLFIGVGRGDYSQLFISPLLKYEGWLYNVMDDKNFEIISQEPPCTGGLKSSHASHRDL